MPCPVLGEFRVMTSGLELLRGGCDVCRLWSCGSCWDALVKCAVLWPDMWHTFQPVWTQYLHVSSVDSPACVQCARNGLALLGWKPLSSWESPVPEAAGEWFQLWEHWWACVSWFLCDSWLIPHPIAEDSWLVSWLASGLHFGTSGTALPVSATVCGKMRMLERNRIPVLCSSLKRCCTCRTFVSAALDICVVTFK